MGKSKLVFPVLENAVFADVKAEHIKAIAKVKENAWGDWNSKSGLKILTLGKV